MLTTKPFENTNKPEVEKEEHRVILMISLILLLTFNFTATTLVQLYFLDSFHNPEKLGFWLIIGNSLAMYSFLLLNKKIIGWNWSQLGLARPPHFWKFCLTTLIVLSLIILIILFIQPLVFQLTSPPDLQHLNVMRNNFPLFLGTLVFVWLHGAFLQEIIFRAFFINVIDIILVNSKWSTLLGIAMSSLAFGLLHAWQGLGGVILTFLMGVIFSTAYVLNGRRLWPLILTHGLIDTLTLLSLYGIF